MKYIKITKKYFLDKRIWNYKETFIFHLSIPDINNEFANYLIVLIHLRLFSKLGTLIFKYLPQRNEGFM